MKNKLILVLAFWLTAGSLAALAPAGEKITVYYFHFTRRCMTCNNVEKVTKETLTALWPDKVKSGDITFKSVNLEEKEGETLGESLKIEGQTLLVVSGKKRVDITEKAFMYANNKPEKLREEIRRAVDGMK